MASANISGARIKEARLKKGWDQVDLSAALSVDFQISLDQSDISEIERYARGIRDYELNAIALCLDVNPTWLLRGNEHDG